MTRQYNKTEKSRLHKDKKRTGDERSPFEVDRSRIVHCTAFRRLQGKTQVFGLGGSDFFRTRLTHSLEAAQIGKGIALRCQADPDLVESACLAHDIGHPPFGHTGEAVLAEKMREYGGFEANAQNLRIVCKLEAKLPGLPGLNLTRATLDALVKYKNSFSQVIDKRAAANNGIKFYYEDDAELVEWICRDGISGERSLECKIMDWADDIAYSTHDLEDGIKADMINTDKVNYFENQLRDNVRKSAQKEGLEWDEEHWKWAIEKIEQASRPKLTHTEHERKAWRKEAISQIITYFIRSSSVRKKNSRKYASRYCYNFVIQEDAKVKCEILKSLVWELIITDERIATLRRKAENVVGTLLDEFTRWDIPGTFQMYPDDFREKLAKANDEEKFRIACDYISGMTDMYALRIYARLFEPEVGSIFEIL